MGRKKAAAENIAEQYVTDVLSGKVVACKWVRLACRRHRKDRELAAKKEGHPRGLRFDEAAGGRVIEFFKFLRHSKGEWAGQVFVLASWQQFYLWCLFGWKRADGMRRFRTAYLEVARKNGKTTKIAGVGIYLFFADGEAGAEVYTAATKRDQARITHSEATRMVKSSPGLRSRIGIFKDNLHVAETASKFEPLGADADSMDGLNIHGALIDELHAHKTRNTWDVLETATGSRRQPLQAAITTAGFDKHSICWEVHEYTEKVLDGIIEDDTWFGIIYTLDLDDDWMDERVWIKANPNIDVSVKRDDLIRKCEQAKEVPTKQNAFLRLHMNIWTESETRWMSAEKWQACSFPVDAEGLRGRRCYGGLDLSSSLDITAWVLVFPPETEGDKTQVLCRFFIPQGNIQQRVRRDRVPYDVWIRQGFMSSTPGDVVDYSFIRAQIAKDSQEYDLREVAYDRWGASKLVQDLEADGMTIVPFGQGFVSMSPPSKELEKMTLGQEIAHGGNPVLAWMASNVVVRMDPAGNIKPDKGKSTERIDGIVALIMAMDRAGKHGEVGSVYETRGFQII